MSNVPSASMGDYRLPEAGRRPLSRSQQALRFFALSSAVILGASGVAAALMRIFGRSPTTAFHFPAAFGATTGLLIAGSVTLHGALRAVRRERQQLFRKRLLLSLLWGSLFMGVQTYALWTIVPAERSAQDASTGVTPFVLMLAILHGLHFLVATLFVSYVYVQALADRYDHEYYWGVSICTWFWHVLGIAWAAILAVYSIVLL